MHGRGLRIDEGVDLCKERVDHSWMDQPPQVVYRVFISKWMGQTIFSKSQKRVIVSQS